MITKGLSKWTKKDFTKFLRASEICGLNDFESISRMMKSKSIEDVEKYVRIFQERIDELPNGQRILSKINKFETEKNKIIENQKFLDDIFEDLSQTNTDIYSKIKIPYKQKTKPSINLYVN